MKILRFTPFFCALCIPVVVACGSSSDGAHGGEGNDAGSPDSGKSAGGSAGSAGTTGGASNGGSTSSGGVSGTGGSTSSGGAATSSGGSGGGGPGTGGASGSDAGTGGASGDAGPTGDGGPTSDGGPMCNGAHPNVNGSSRTCNAGFCYCSGKDACFPQGAASSCCVETVVCGAGAVNPTATINHPGDGETRAANVDIPFVGVATDPQDGALTGASLVWTSDQLGSPIGTGTSFQAALPAGTHVITLTAADSDSNTGTDSITLIIQ